MASYKDLPMSSHILFKKVYILYGKDAPQKHELWWARLEYYDLVNHIIHGGILYNDDGCAFDRYTKVGVMSCVSGSDYVLADEYIDFIMNI